MLFEWRRCETGRRKNRTDLQAQHGVKRKFVFKNLKAFEPDLTRMYFVMIDQEDHVFVVRYRSRYEDMIGPFPDVKSAKAACILLSS